MLQVNRGFIKKAIKICGRGEGTGSQDNNPYHVIPSFNSKLEVSLLDQQ